MEHKNSRGPTPLLIFVIWLIFTLGVALIGFPRVRRGISESGVATLLATRSSQASEDTTMRRVRTAFILSDGSARPFSSLAKRYGGSQYHDTFEALLDGPPLEALKAGAVSYIEPKTRLRGITLSNGVLYVDFSRSYGQSEYQDRADLQVKTTALQFSGVKDVVILIEGEVVP